MRQLKIIKQVTNRETVSLDKYLHEIGKVDLLSTDDEVALARKIKEGDPETRVIWDLLKQLSALTKRGDLNLYPTPFGGLGSLFCRRWPSRQEL